MGGKIEELIPERGIFCIVLRGKKIFISRKFEIANNLITGKETTKYKDLTYLLFKNKNIPTPETVALYKKTTQKELQKKLRPLRFPIVVKDAQGSQSKGVFTNVTDMETAVKIINREIKNFPKLVAQEMVFGNEYRLTILGGKLLGATKLIPPRVYGNGKDDLKKLIETKQKNTRRKTPLDSLLRSTLAEQGFSLRSVPKKGKLINIRKNSVLDEGGETEDVTDKVHKKIISICATAARATGKYLAGIDVMCDDIGRDPRKQNFNIIEINGKPDIYLHYNPTRGKTRNVVKDIVNYIFRLKGIDC